MFRDYALINVVDLHGPEHCTSEKAKSIKSLNYGRKLDAIKDPITFQLYNSLSDLQILEEDWSNLYKSNKSDFKNTQSYDWVVKACKKLAANKGFELSILVGRQRGHVVMIMPLVIYRTPTFSKLQFISDLEDQYTSVLMSHHSSRIDWLARAYVYLRTALEWDVLHLQDVKAHSILMLFLKYQNALCLKNAEKHTFDCSISRNFKGQAFTGYMQSQALAQATFRQIKQLYSTGS